MNTKIIALACAATLLANTAAGQTARNCAEHTLIVEQLASGYGESRQSIGMSSDNTVVEVFASHETGSWTITVTQAGGPTCLVASGTGYQALNEELPSTDSGA